MWLLDSLDWMKHHSLTSHSLLQQIAALDMKAGSTHGLKALGACRCCHRGIVFIWPSASALYYGILVSAHLWIAYGTLACHRSLVMNLKTRTTKESYNDLMNFHQENIKTHLSFNINFSDPFWESSSALTRRGQTWIEKQTKNYYKWTGLAIQSVWGMMKFVNQPWISVNAIWITPW